MLLFQLMSQGKIHNLQKHRTPTRTKYRQGAPSLHQSLEANVCVQQYMHTRTFSAVCGGGGGTGGALKGNNTPAGRKQRPSVFSRRYVQKYIPERFKNWSIGTILRSEVDSVVVIAYTAVDRRRLCLPWPLAYSFPSPPPQPPFHPHSRYLRFLLHIPFFLYYFFLSTLQNTLSHCLCLSRCSCFIFFSLRAPSSSLFLLFVDFISHIFATQKCVWYRPSPSIHSRTTPTNFGCQSPPFAIQLFFPRTLSPSIDAFVSNRFVVFGYFD